MGSLWRHGSGPQARPPVGFSTGQPVKAGSSSTRLWAAIFGWLLVRYRFPCPPSPVRVRRRPPMSSTPCRPSTSRGTFAIPTTCPSSTHLVGPPRHEGMGAVRIPGTATVDGVAVYWFDDTAIGGACRVPNSWNIQYRDNEGRWRPVPGNHTYPTHSDAYNAVSFPPTKTSALRMEVQLAAGYSGGILEWRVQETQPKKLLQPGQWQHVAATCSAQGTMTLYHNGRMIGHGTPRRAATISRAYALQRFVTACQARGEALLSSTAVSLRLNRSSAIPNTPAVPTGVCGATVTGTKTPVTCITPCWPPGILTS